MVAGNFWYVLVKRLNFQNLKVFFQYHHEPHVKSGPNFPKFLLSANQYFSLAAIMESKN